MWWPGSFHTQFCKDTLKAVLIQKFIFLIINIRVQGLAVFLLNDMLGERIVVYMLELLFFLLPWSLSSLEEGADFGESARVVHQPSPYVKLHKLNVFTIQCCIKCVVQVKSSILVFSALPRWGRTIHEVTCGSQDKVFATRSGSQEKSKGSWGLLFWSVCVALWHNGSQNCSLNETFKGEISLWRNCLWKRSLARSGRNHRFNL